MRREIPANLFSKSAGFFKNSTILKLKSALKYLEKNSDNLKIEEKSLRCKLQKIRRKFAPEVHDMQNFPAKNFSSAASKTSEDFGELEEVFEWEDEFDLAKEIAEIGKDDEPLQEIPLDQIKIDDKISAKPSEKSACASAEKFDISEDISQDFFAVKTSKKKGGLLQAATKLRSIPGFGSSEHEDAALNFSTAVPNFGEHGFSVNEKIAANKKSLLAKAISIASVSDEVICQGADGIFSINENLKIHGVHQDDSFMQLVDSVLGN